MRSHLQSVLPVFDEIRAAHPDYFEPDQEARGKACPGVKDRTT